MKAVLEVEGDRLLGPVVHVNGRHPVSWITVVRSIWSLLLGILFARHRPNVFFTSSGRPIARPEVVR